MGTKESGCQMAMRGTPRRPSARFTVLIGGMLHVACGQAVPAPGGNEQVVVEPLVVVAETKLVASDGAANDRLGGSVALSGETALVGAQQHDGLRGAAYVYTRNGASWTLQQKLTALGGEPYDHFGSSVALSGDTALVGAYVAGSTAQGSAYVFVRNGMNWTLQQALTTSDGANAFGCAVALSGDTALVGTCSFLGSAYVFVRTGTTWTEQQKLTASDGSGGDEFGVSVALSGDTALVGAQADGVGANASQGSAYAYLRSGTSWTEQRKLTASGGMPEDFFGHSVALSNDTALVGAFGNQGSAYVYSRSGAIWSEQPKLAAPAAAALGTFGSAVALFGDVALVGAPWDANGTQGSAYVYLRSKTGFSEQAELTASDGAQGDNFGASVTLSGQTALVGAYLDDIDTNSNQGSGYTFRLRGFDRDACDTDAECASAICIDGVCRTACSQDSACPEGTYCSSNGACEAQKEQGSPCDLARGADCMVANCQGCASDLHCVDGVCCESDCNGLCEACSASLTGDDDGLCEPVRDGDDPDDDCDAESSDPESCRGEGVCDGNRQCRVCHCIDGVCCDETCVGQCEACNEPGNEGSCIAVEGEPRGDRDTCDGEGECAGACDGRERSTCSYPEATTVCDSRCEGQSEIVSHCDGAGVCQQGSPEACAPYACIETACLTECSGSSDCADGHRCRNAKCVPVTGASSCSPDGAESQPENGEPVACGAYLCDPTTGGCRIVCDSTSQCAAGYVCNPSSNRCDRVPSAAEEDGGCGCRSAGSTRHGSALATLAALVGLALLARRRRKS
jgi:MYXO-CTERM domain-containing protein